MNYKPLLILGGVMIVVVAGVAFAYKTMQGSSPASGAYTELAQCIKDSGAKFYGAFWCPHCKDQKKLFGDAADILPYVECSTPDGKAQLDVCKEAGVQSYPTWVFASGQRTTGTIALSSLAKLTNCPAPVEPVTGVPVTVPASAGTTTENPTQ